MVDRKKTQMKQRNNKEENIYWTERICNEEIDRNSFKLIHLRSGHASKNIIKRFMEESRMKSNLQIRNTDELMESAIANCTPTLTKPEK